MRHIYIVEADQKAGHDFSIPKRIFYIDSEGWLIIERIRPVRHLTASCGRPWCVVQHLSADRPVCPMRRSRSTHTSGFFSSAWSTPTCRTAPPTVSLRASRHSPRREYRPVPSTQVAIYPYRHGFSSSAWSTPMYRTAPPRWSSCLLAVIRLNANAGTSIWAPSTPASSNPNAMMNAGH